MKHILLTGFESFHDIVVNPSETLVNQLFDSIHSGAGYQCEKIVLPVDYQKAGEIMSGLDFSQYDFVFQFGVAAERRKVSLERVALNWIESTLSDSSGLQPSQKKILTNSPDAFFSSLDLATLSKDLNQRCNHACSEVSFTAGAFLCNFVYYLSLSKTSKCLFTHIPLCIKYGDHEWSSHDKRYQEAVCKIAQQIISFVI
ncbi:MAG: hypothetical protein JNL11_19150 [Bdellovibrionaceae bacterium]|nr:hypothetical protein [Pseudobdellovibrionaceae bacterium]